MTVLVEVESLGCHLFISTCANTCAFLCLIASTILSKSHPQNGCQSRYQRVRRIPLVLVLANLSSPIYALVSVESVELSSEMP